MILPVSKLADHPHAEAALIDLCRPFTAALLEGFVPECRVVQPDEIPFPEDQLLVHHAHMTEVLERHHGSPVEVHVMQEAREGDIYTRKIALTPRDQPGKIVELGVAKLDLRYLAPEVKQEILAKELPLGAVLIKHNVLRRVKPRWFMQFPANGPMARLFGHIDTSDRPIYGRIGTIYCDGEPAIEVVELVTNVGQ